MDRLGAHIDQDMLHMRELPKIRTSKGSLDTIELIFYLANRGRRASGERMSAMIGGIGWWCVPDTKRSEGPTLGNRLT